MTTLINNYTNTNNTTSSNSVDEPILTLNSYSMLINMESDNEEDFI